MDNFESATFRPDIELSPSKTKEEFPRVRSFCQTCGITRKKPSRSLINSNGRSMIFMSN